MIDPLVHTVAATIATLAVPRSRLLVAVSGGADSTALLDLLWRGRAVHRLELCVGHVDHGIAADSAAVADAVRSLAATRDLPFVLRRLALGATCSETRARAERRRALRALADEAGAQAIALAHHAGDQQETILLRVLQGSGPDGLAGMAARRGPWLRPLLTIAPDALREHLTRERIAVWHDPANSDPRHLRSWLRTAAFPLLEARLPGLRRALLGLAEQSAAARSAWNQVPALIPELDLRLGERSLSVAAAPLRGYRSPVQRAVLSALGRRFGVPFGRHRQAALGRLLAGERSGGRVALGAALEAELSFDRLVLRRPEPGYGEIALPSHGEVRAGRHRLRVTREVATAPARGGWRVQLGVGQYVVRPWRSGDRIRPLGGTGTRAVAELFKEGRVAVGDRAVWPVLERDDATLVWVPGICRSDVAIPAAGEEALSVECDLA